MLGPSRPRTRAARLLLASSLLLLGASCSLDRTAFSLGDAGTPDGGNELICPPGYEDANGDPEDGCECQFIAEIDVCNGLDDDCDPSTPDGSEDTALGAPCDGRDEDFCAGGMTGCGEEGDVVCMNDVPSPEVCDDLLGDENCNGTVDEGCACTGSETRPCGLDVGACMEGTQTCVDGAWSDCEGGVNPIDELCNGEDDNCDGSTDEAFPTLEATCIVGMGECLRMGRNVCNGAGDGVECSETAGTPTDERCNDRDDDCDGRVDEAFGDLGDPCTEGVGACARTGRRICNGSGGGTTCSVSAGMGSGETCNTADDDCDGRVDEGLGLGERCSVGVGACEREGEQVCDGGGGVTCNATPGAPSTETCGGGDEDCDGMVNEGFMLGMSCTEGTGDCRTSGTIMCTSATSSDCNAVPDPPGTEVCGGGDEDCDGNTDETTEACTIHGCTGTRPCGGACTPDGSEVSAETCNGMDDDCDGATDEEFDVGEVCMDGLCSGTWACNPEGGQDCVALGGGTETCNAQDDDCDGSIDEGGACGASCAVVGPLAGRIYLRCTSQRELSAAESYCSDRVGWTIASLETDAERTGVYGLVSGVNNRWWVGLRAPGGNWRWSSGADAPDSGTPPWRSDPSGDPPCAHLRDGELDDENCDQDRRFICEAPAP